MDVDVEECTGPNIDEAEGLGKDKEIFPWVIQLEHWKVEDGEPGKSENKDNGGQSLTAANGKEGPDCKPTNVTWTFLAFPALIQS
jgi:hypothetical protein